MLNKLVKLITCYLDTTTYNPEKTSKIYETTQTDTTTYQEGTQIDTSTYQEGTQIDTTVYQEGTSMTTPSNLHTTTSVSGKFLYKTLKHFCFIDIF